MSLPPDHPMEPSSPPVECPECDETFLAEDGPICPYCDVDLREIGDDND